MKKKNIGGKKILLIPYAANCSLEREVDVDDLNRRILNPGYLGVKRVDKY